MNVKVKLVGKDSFECPETNLDNIKRIYAGQIEKIEYVEEATPPVIIKRDKFKKNGKVKPETEIIEAPTETIEDVVESTDEEVEEVKTEKVKPTKAPKAPKVKPIKS